MRRESDPEVKGVVLSSSGRALFEVAFPGCFDVCLNRESSCEQNASNAGESGKPCAVNAAASSLELEVDEANETTYSTNAGAENPSNEMSESEI